MTRAEAERVLDDIVGLALAEGAAALCDEENGLHPIVEICKPALVDVGENSTPKERPRIVSFKPGKLSENTLPSAELELQGVDGLGQPYHQDLYIVRDGDRVFARAPIWWSRFAGRDLTWPVCSTGCYDHSCEPRDHPAGAPESKR